MARTHREALEEASAPMLDVADPVLRVELQARSERAALREAIALADLILQIDQYRAEARLDGV